MLSPEENHLRARAAASARWGRLDYSERLAATAAGRQAAADRFRRQAVAEGATGRDIALRAASLKRAHYAKAQRAAVAARRRAAGLS